MGLIEAGKKHDSRPVGGSVSMTAGSGNITVQTSQSSKLSQTAPNPRFVCTTTAFDRDD